jgi:hypothetical protein
MTTSKMERQQSSVVHPTINFIWIGPYSKIPGHDIIGPLRMAALNTSNPIEYFCLERYLERYRLRLNTDGIRVTSIESFLASQTIPALQDYATQLRNIMDFLLSYNTISDRVIFKDYFSLFLLRAKFEYFADTNVYPRTDQTSIELPAGNSPGITIGYDEPPMNSEEELWGHSECFFMYIPNNAQGIQTIDAWLQEYLKQWPDIKRMRLSGQRDYSQVANGKMIDAISSQPLSGNSNFYYYQYPNGYLSYGLQKRFFNTHKPKNRAQYITPRDLARSTFMEECSDVGFGQGNGATKNPILECIFSFFYEESSSLIERIAWEIDEEHPDVQKIKGWVQQLKQEHASNSDGINTQFVFRNRKITLLHLAVSQDKFEVLHVLLEEGADILLKISFPELELGDLTALELAKILRFESSAKILRTHSVELLEPSETKLSQ